LARASRAHVAARLGPLLALIDAQRADETDDRATIRKEAHHIRAPFDLLVQALLEGWYLRSGARVPVRKCHKATRSERAYSRCSAILRQPPQPAHCGPGGTEAPPRSRQAHRGSLALGSSGLLVIWPPWPRDRTSRRCDKRCQVTRVSPIAKASPCWASQAHEHHPREPSCHERAPASEPAGLVLRWWRPKGAEALAMSLLSAHPGEDQPLAP